LKYIKQVKGERKVMIKTINKLSEITKEFKKRISEGTQIITIDELLIVLPKNKKRGLKNIRGILSGEFDKSSVELVREERKNWK
jgi:hypothetical protein